MITPVGSVVSAPALVHVATPAVVPVAPAAAVSAQLEQGHDRNGGHNRSASDPRSVAELRGQAPTSPPEPISTQAVLLLRQNGASVAGIAEAYGISVDSVRRLLHAGDEEAERVVLADAAHQA